jgi:hypothetical protein
VVAVQPPLGQPEESAQGGEQARSCREREEINAWGD